MALTEYYVAALVKAHPGPWRDKATQATAVAVAMAESGGRAGVYNGICCYGLWQINLSAHRDKIPGKTTAAKIAYLKTSMGNLNIAQQVWSEAGGSWSPWSAYTNGSYGKYLQKAGNAVGNMTPAQQQQLLDQIQGLGTAGGDALGLGGVRDAAGAVLSPLEGISAAISWVADPHNWLRLATFVGGLAVLLVVTASLLRQTSLGSAALGAATKGAVS